MVIQPPSQGQELARREAGAGRRRFGDGLVRPGSWHELPTTIRFFYEKMRCTPFLSGLQNGYLLAAQRMRGVSHLYR